MPSSTACYSTKPLSEPYKKNSPTTKPSSTEASWGWVCFSFLVSLFIFSDDYIYNHHGITDVNLFIPVQVGHRLNKYFVGLAD